MNNFINQVIDEAFKSKKQQRYFYAKAGDKSLPKKERNKWSNLAKEFSSKTDFNKIPEKSEDLDEIVDELGNISRGKKPKNRKTKGIGSDSITDKVVKTGANTMGTHGVHGTHTSLRYWAESDISGALGYDETMGKDKSYDDAKDHYEDELNLKPKDAEDRMAQLGYDEDLPGDKVRLIENPQKYIEEYIESILSKKTDINDIFSNSDKEINPILLKQIKSLKNSLESNDLSVEDIIKYLKNNE
jgi:hypothetical protein